METAAKWVAFLDDVARLDFIRSEKLQVADMLDLHPGDIVLDAGCGTGDDARNMANLVGRDGRVTGLDSDDAILEEARRRAEGTTLPLTFTHGDVHHLDFADGTFTRCRSERMFQHVADPHAAMRELARVLRPDGLMVVFDTDWETLIIDAADWQTTRILMHEYCSEHRHGWIGRMLPGLMREAGLGDIEVVPGTLILRDFALAERLHTMTRTAAVAVTRGLITNSAADAWLADLRARDSEGRFFSAVTAFIVKGRKP
jgi:ubiquinone/menaquinone biosynthesis C-methylase UbiE